MGYWDKIKKDIQKAFDDGIHLVKEGTSSVLDRAELLAEEGKKKVKSFELKQKLQVQFTELGGRLHDLIDRKVKTPLSHPSLKPILTRIETLKKQLSQVEEEPKPKTKKKTAKKKAVKKKTLRKKTVKKKTTTPSP